MLTKAVFATLVAREGKEAEVEVFLRSAKTIIEGEPGTRTWYAVKINSREYGIFDTFDDEKGMQTHLHGRVAEALAAQAPELFSEDPIISTYDILANT
ncbi:antibiotic biosynthesis monooxygenase [Candidatus Saccharibacteria bacterium]|nr:antibiotic biosynthesis monooxygenase [Candidatus Saccharibacteria bacterium]